MAKYTILIDEILGRSDLSKISAKKIRKELAAKLEKDISSQKVRSLEHWEYIVTTCANQD